MIKFEFKKLLLKQYGLILIAILVILKTFSSAELFKPDYGALTPQQREIYIGYINELGGTLTDEKEAEILNKYALLTEAKSDRTEIERKRENGEYATMEEYFEELSKLPAILSDSAAIEKLYERYESVAKDREHRVLLAYDAPAMTVGQEYWLLFFICFISAASIYYERKINNLQKTSPNGKKGYAAKLLAIFSVICFLWLAFAAIEFFALLSTVSTENLSASLASLEDFKETPYFDMTILGGFWAIQLIKLIGYLFTSAVTLIIILISKNLVLSIFAPAALNVAWLYLFSNHTAGYYQPFSLMRGAPYLTGAHHAGTGVEYDEIPQEILAGLITVAAVFIAIAYIAVICEGKNHLKSKSAGKRKKAALLSVITLSAMIFGGCSALIDESLESIGHDGFLAEREENYYILQYETDSSHQVIASKITAVDKDLNVISDNIIRDVFDGDPLIHGIYEDGGYIYYSGDFNDGSRINRISLDDFSEETVYFGDYAPFKGQRKYFDMITVWSKSYYGDSITVNDFFVNEGKAVISMQNGAVYLLDVDPGVMTYLFEDSEVEGLCANNGKIYYLNMTGELICFYGSEKHRVSDRIFGGICSDGEYLYGCGVSGVYRYDNEFNETMLSGAKGSRISAYDGCAIFDSENGWVYIDGESETNIGEAEEAYACKDGFILFRNHEWSFYEMEVSK